MKRESKYLRPCFILNVTANLARESNGDRKNLTI